MSLSDYKAYQKPQAKGASYASEKRLPVEVSEVTEADRARFENVFLRSYLRYRPMQENEIAEMADALGTEVEGQGGLQFKRAQARGLMTLLNYNEETSKHFGEALSRKLSEVRDVLDLNWKRFTEDKDTMCFLARPAKDQSALAEEDRVSPRVVVGITYATRTFDPASGLFVARIEGTYVPGDYRKRGIGSQLIAGIADTVKEKLGVDEVQFWTHSKNPYTGNVYPNIKTDHGKSVETDEHIWVLGLNQTRAERYQCREGQPLLPASQCYETRRVSEADHDTFIQLANKFLSMRNGIAQDGEAEALWQQAQENPRLYAALIERDGEAVGMAVMYESIKLPRDAFLTADVGAFYLESEHRNFSASQAALSQLAEAAASDPTIQAMRWTLPAGDPHARYMDTDVAINAEETLRPTELPFRTFRLPLSEKAVYHGPVKERGRGASI